MDIKEFQKLVLDKAKKAGFGDCEIYYRSDDDFQVLVRDGKAEHYETSSSGGAAFRGIINGKTGSAYTERLDENAADFIIKSAMENAQISEDEECIFYEGGEYSDICLYDESLEKVTAEEKIDKLAKMEKAALGYSDKIKSSDRCMFADGSVKISIMNTKGLNKSYNSNIMMSYISVICEDNGDIKTGGEFFAGNDISAFDPESIGKSASEQAEKMLGASPVKSGAYNVVFKNTAMADLLGTFSSAFSGEQAYKGLSMLEGMEEKSIASECVSIRDDGLLEGGMASALFDGEGVPCRNKVIVENGVLKTLLYDLKYAAKCGKKSTGNGFRSGYRSQVFCGPSNFYIVPSDKDFDDIIKEAGDGIYITDIEGLHAGANIVSGDFSLSAQGFVIKDGKLERPVEQITAAANFFELLKNIKAVGKDLRFNTGGIGAPSVFMENISISGL